MNIFQFMRNRFLKFFGDLKIFKYPFFMLYHPAGYKVKGDDIRQVIKTIQTGDILIRGYVNYLDGYFIPGHFSHAGLYIGEVKPGQLNIPDAFKNVYKEGEQIAIHSMAEGVFMEDIINFCRCDYLVILRRNDRTEPDLDPATMNEEVLKRAYANLGKPYDFKFDFSNYHTMSCTEFVYQCCDEFMAKYKVGIKKRSVLFKSIEMIIPDDFVTNEFDVAFKSASVKQEVLDRIMAKNATETFVNP